MFEFQQRRNSASFYALKQSQRRGLSRFDIEHLVLLASNLLSPRLTKSASFFRSCPVHDRDNTPLSRANATRRLCAQIRTTSNKLLDLHFILEARRHWTEIESSAAPQRRNPL
jgi:hypothetical protein